MSVWVEENLISFFLTGAMNKLTITEKQEWIMYVEYYESQIDMEMYSNPTRGGLWIPWERQGGGHMCLWTYI